MSKTRTPGWEIPLQWTPGGGGWNADFLVSPDGEPLLCVWLAPTRGDGWEFGVLDLHSGQDYVGGKTVGTLARAKRDAEAMVLAFLSPPVDKLRELAHQLYRPDLADVEPESGS